MPVEHAGPKVPESQRRIMQPSIVCFHHGEISIAAKGQVEAMLTRGITFVDKRKQTPRFNEIDPSWNMHNVPTSEIWSHPIIVHQSDLRKARELNQIPCIILRARPRALPGRHEGRRHRNAVLHFYIVRFKGTL